MCSFSYRMLGKGWLHERMNPDIFGLNSIWTELYLKLWTHERTNAQQFWWQKIWELWFHWFERTNAWTQTFLVSFLFGLIHTSNFERMNARTHNNFETKKLRALISLVWTHERMNADIFGLNSIWTEPYLKLSTHERMNAQQFWYQKIWELWFNERMNAGFSGFNSVWQISIHSNLSSSVLPWAHYCSNIECCSLNTMKLEMCCNFFWNPVTMVT